MKVLEYSNEHTALKNFEILFVSRIIYKKMNIQRRLQIEFEALGSEKISGETALAIVNTVFDEAKMEKELSEFLTDDN